MFTKEELENRKYNELLKISRGFGVKGGRQKTVKLISLILKAQDELISEDESDNVEMLEDIEFPDSGLESSSENFALENQSQSGSPTPKSLVSDDDSKFDESVLPKSKTGKTSLPAGKKLLRSGTFELSEKINSSKGVQNPPTLIHSGNSKIESEKSTPKETRTSVKLRLSKNFEMSTEENTVNGNKHPHGLTHSGTSDISAQNNSPKEAKHKLTRSGTFDMSTEESFLKENKRLTRSGTFNISPKENSPKVNTQRRRMTRSGIVEEKVNNAKLDFQPRNRKHSRSNTFEMDNTKVGNVFRTSSGSLSEKEQYLYDKDSEKNKPIVKSKRQSQGNEVVDLFCSEVQTAEDIKNLEENNSNVSPRPLRKSNAVQNYLVTSRSSSRKSLRGRLLESTLSAKAKVLPSPLSVDNKNDKQVSASISDKDDTPKLKDKKDQLSNIPRFVAYARKKRMPNFARIHEQVFEKMEAVDDYVNRKHTRSKTFLTPSSSAKKDPLNFKPVTSTKNMNINFSVAKSPTAVFSKTVTPGKTNVYSKVSTKNISSAAALVESSCIPEMGISGNKRKSITRNRSFSRPVKENRSPLRTATARASTPGSLQKRMEYDATIAKPVAKPSRFPVKSASNRQILKHLVGKNPKIKSSDDMRSSQRSFLKGVRLNKRFELQMAKRGIDL